MGLLQISQASGLTCRRFSFLTSLSFLIRQSALVEQAGAALGFAGGALALAHLGGVPLIFVIVT